ncbi:hypothetical protein ES705_46054 [subsurface metagenome]
MVGHCSKCHKIWTLEAKRGICQWCGQQAYCQTTTTLARLPKSSSQQTQRQPAIDKGYNQLEGKWLTYYKVAVKFLRKVDSQEREDLLHTIILNLAIADENGDRPDTTSWMYGVAHFTVFDFIYEWCSRLKGIRCHNCSHKQRNQCREHNTRGAKCPKAVHLESLYRQVRVGSEGSTVELIELIPAKAPDIETQRSFESLINKCPERLLDIVEKKFEGRVLGKPDISYLWKWQGKLRQVFPELAAGRKPRIGRPRRRRKTFSNRPREEVTSRI